MNMPQQPPRPSKPRRATPEDEVHGHLALRAERHRAEASHLRLRRRRRRLQRRQQHDHRGLEGVEFIVANTDAQQLAYAKTDRRIQLGTRVTEGWAPAPTPRSA
jgi:hypothetical protein